MASKLKIPPGTHYFFLSGSITVGSNGEITAGTIDSSTGSAPLTAPATISLDLAENATSAGFAQGSGGVSALQYTNLAGPDAALFSLDLNTGELTKLAAADRESPAEDANGDYIYQITYDVTDGTDTIAQAATITLTDVNETPPNFTSPTAISVMEGASGVLFTAVATDLDATGAVTYSLTGADAAQFSLNTNTGEVSPAGGSIGAGTYSITINALSQGDTTPQSVTVTVSVIADTSFGPAAFRSELNAAEEGDATNAVIQARMGSAPSWEIRDAADNVLATGAQATLTYVPTAGSVNAHVDLTLGTGFTYVADGTPSDIVLINGGNTARMDNNASTLNWTGGDISATTKRVDFIGTFA